MASKENLRSDQLSTGVDAEENVTGTEIQSQDDGEPSTKISKTNPTKDITDDSWVVSYRRVIAILPGAGKKGTMNNEVESSDDEGSDARSEGVIETSSSSSEFDEGIPFPTKPKVIAKRTEVEQGHAHN